MSWIEIKDGCDMPLDGIPVLTVIKTGAYSVLQRHGEFWRTRRGRCFVAKPTYWQPITPPLAALPSPGETK